MSAGRLLQTVEAEQQKVHPVHALGSNSTISIGFTGGCRNMLTKADLMQQKKSYVTGGQNWACPSTHTRNCIV